MEWQEAKETVHEGPIHGLRERVSASVRQRGGWRGRESQTEPDKV